MRIQRVILAEAFTDYGKKVYDVWIIPGEGGSLCDDDRAMTNKIFRSVSIQDGLTNPYYIPEAVTWNLREAVLRTESEVF